MKYVEKHPMSLLLLGILGISVSAIFVRYSDAPSTVTAAFRMLWTVLFLTPAVFASPARRQELRRISRRAVLLSCLSGFFLAAHFVLWFESLQHTSVARSTTIVCTEVIWVSLGFCLFLKGRIAPKAAAAIAVALAGSVLIAWSDSGSGAHLYGDILAWLAAVATALYTLIGQVLRRSMSTTVYTWLVYASCGAVLLIACAVQGYGLFAYGPSAVLVGLALAVLSTIMGHSIFSWALKYFSPSFVSACKLCEPAVAAVLAAFLFAEIPSALQLAGGALILGGVFFYSRIEAAQQARKQA